MCIVLGRCFLLGHSTFRSLASDVNKNLYKFFTRPNVDVVDKTNALRCFGRNKPDARLIILLINSCLCICTGSECRKTKISHKRNKLFEVYRLVLFPIIQNFFFFIPICIGQLWYSTSYSYKDRSVPDHGLAFLVKLFMAVNLSVLPDRFSELSLRNVSRKLYQGNQLPTL